MTSQPRFNFESMPTLETERLSLRQFDRGIDLMNLYTLFSDPEVARYTDTEAFQSLDDARDVADWIEGVFRDKQGMRWVIAHREEPEALIGTAGFNVWNRWNDSAEIAYDLAQRFWGRGLAGEALEVLIKFGFTEMGLHRIEADVTIGNRASERVLEKLGFTREGVLRGRGKWKGAYHDLTMFSLLEADWREATA